MAAQEKVFSSFNFFSACTHSIYCISKIMFSFFSHLINFLKAPTDLEFLISTVRFLHSFKQYGEKVFLKDFVLDKESSITEADTDVKE